jgi:hypothetical protein
MKVGIFLSSSTKGCGLLRCIHSKQMKKHIMPSKVSGEQKGVPGK